MSERRVSRLGRADPAARVRKDLERLERREPEARFWRSLSLIGSVGWPIALLGVGGGLFGRYLDARWQTGVRFTLTLLTLGVAAGSVLAFRALREGGR